MRASTGRNAPAMTVLAELAEAEKIDPSHDGSEVVPVVYDRIRAEFYRRIGIAELLPEQASL
jgi:hypothetical protein